MDVTDGFVWTIYNSEGASGEMVGTHRNGQDMSGGDKQAGVQVVTKRSRHLVGNPEEALFGGQGRDGNCALFAHGHD